jgi:hypothetical protein
MLAPVATGTLEIHWPEGNMLVNPNEIETTDSADFADFEEVIGTNLFVAKFQGIDNRNLLYPCNRRNLWLNPFRFLG